MAIVRLEIWDNPAPSEEATGSLTIDPPIYEEAMDGLTTAQFLGVQLALFLKERNIQFVGDFPSLEESDESTDV